MVSDGLLADLNMWFHSQFFAQVFCSDGSVAKIYQPFEQVVLVSRHSGRSEQQALFSAAKHLKSF